MHTTCFTKAGHKTKHCSLIWHSRLREGTTKIILAFQIAFIEGTVQQYQHASKRHVGRCTVLKPLLKWRPITWLMFFSHAASAQQYQHIYPLIQRHWTYGCPTYRSSCIMQTNLSLKELEHITSLSADWFHVPSYHSDVFMHNTEYRSKCFLTRWHKFHLLQAGIWRSKEHPFSILQDRRFSFVLDCLLSTFAPSVSIRIRVIRLL